MTEQKEHTKITKPVTGSVFDEMPAKFAFWSGIVTGAAVLSLLAVLVMVVLMVKGISLTPSANDNDTTTADSKAENAEPTNVAPTPAPAAAADPEAGVAPASGNIDVAAAKNVRGTGDVTIVEFSDFDCPFCKRFTPTIDQIVEDYDGQVKHVYKHFPLTNIHPDAERDAIASECAGDQGKFWEMHDQLFEKQDVKGKDALTDIATDIGLDVAAFETCLSDPAKKTLVQADAAEGQSLGCTGTPCPLLVVDGEVKQQFRGAVPVETIEAALAEYVQ